MSAVQTGLSHDHPHRDAAIDDIAVAAIGGWPGSLVRGRMD
jgi:hypothetical protein